ncbi:MAG: DUF1631 family protein [Pseudomonadales bacterium]|nr:DUF1631 family protein [Pseudomonadales bacterium]
MDKRIYKRVPFDHEAKIEVKGKVHSCCIRDFSPGGVLLDLQSSGNRVPAGIDGVTFGSLIRVVLVSQQDARVAKITFSGEVRHQRAGGIGVRFYAISDQQLAELASLCRYRWPPEPQVSQTAESRGANGNAKKLSEYYQVTLKEQLPVALNRVLTSASEKLLYAFNDATDSWLRADYNLGLQMLEARTNWISQKVCQSVVSRVKLLLQGGAVEGESEADDLHSMIQLQVVEKDTFEEWLSMTSAVRVIENSLGPDITRLSRLFSTFSAAEVDFQNCPVGPGFVLKNVSAAFDNLEFPSSAQQLVFKTIGKGLLNDLRDLYALLISGAERLGIQIVADTGEQTTSSTAEQLPAASPNLESNPAPLESGVLPLSQGLSSMPVPGSSAGVPGNLLDHLALLNTTLCNGGGLTSSGVQAQGDVVAGVGSEQPRNQFVPGLSAKCKETLLTMIDSIASQPDAQQGDSGSNAQALHELVGKQLNLAQLGASDQAEMLKGLGLMQVTDQLFQSFAAEERVVGPLKPWFEEIKCSMAKVIVNDPTFFSDSHHPARLFLNQLARLGAVKRTSNKSLERSLANFSERIQTQYHGSNDLFVSLLDDVNHLVERQEQAFSRNAERIARTYEGQQTLARARHYVAQCLAEILNGKPVPDSVLAFLEEGGWRNYLVVTLLREGQESTTFIEAVGVIGTLLRWFEQEESEHLEHDFEMELEAHTLIDTIDRELKATGQTGYKRWLNTILSQLMGETGITSTRIDQYKWRGEGEEEIEQLNRAAEVVKPKDRWQRRAVSLKVGDWVLVSLPGEEPQRMRLAWSGTNFYRFVFVSNSGLQDIDVTLEDFAEGIREGRYQVLSEEDVPLVDQGLHKMVQTVYEDIAGTASCDPLTALLNRQEFERHLDRTVVAAIRHGVQLTVCYIDVDQFRLINNAYGHTAGDEILKQVARLVQNHCDSEVICSRIGGNEFGLIFRDTEKSQVLLRLERLRKALADATFTWLEHSFQITASIGYAQINPGTDSVDSLMRKVYLACESAKEHGRNRVVEYALHDKDQLRQDEMMAWVKKIDLQLDELLSLRCQEIRPLNGSASASHFEILLAVYDDERKLLPPINLIEAAEHFGRMTRIDQWVVSNVLQWMEANPAILATLEGLSINLSGASLGDDQFLEFVLAALETVSFDKGKICFEVTETAAITSLNEAVEFIVTLKNEGCKFALDDFGTGLSSYAYIQRLPVDYLKIDGVFIKNITNNKKDEALVRSINDLAHVMGMKTTAEYVENEQIIDLLKEIGVDKAQGYGVHKPMLLADLCA